MATIGEIVEKKQPDIYRKLMAMLERKEERLSFSYIEKLMRHDSYVRHRGAIAQRRWSG